MKQKFVFQWHITHKCNLRCKHCYQEEYCKDLEIDELIRIFHQIKEFLKKNKAIGHINFTGGEPLLSKHLWRLMDLSEKYQISFGILTNGVLIDKEVVKKLREYEKIRFVQVSIDGIEETHDNIRGAGNFAKAMEGLKLLRKAGIQTMVSFTLSKSNGNELKKVIRLCEKAKIDRFWTDRLIPMGNNSLDCLTTKEYGEILQLLGRESRRAKRLPWIKTKVHTNRALQFMCCGSDNGIYECAAGKNLLAILADGTLFPCRRLPIKLGDLTTENISNIVENHELIHQLRSNKREKECQGCVFLCKCNGGAKCLTYAFTGQLQGKDLNCMVQNSDITI